MEMTLIGWSDSAVEGWREEQPVGRSIPVLTPPSPHHTPRFGRNQTSGLAFREGEVIKEQLVHGSLITLNQSPPPVSSKLNTKHTDFWNPPSDKPPLLVMNYFVHHKRCLAWAGWKKRDKRGDKDDHYSHVQTHAICSFSIKTRLRFAADSKTNRHTFWFSLVRIPQQNVTQLSQFMPLITHCALHDQSITGSHHSISLRRPPSNKKKYWAQIGFLSAHLQKQSSGASVKNTITHKR